MDTKYKSHLRLSGKV